MIKIGITQGDINGISCELILKVLEDERMVEICTPVVYGASKIANYHQKTLNTAQINYHQTNSAKNLVSDKVNIINCIDGETQVEFGISSELADKASVESLTRAAQDLEEGLIDVIITNPINPNIADFAGNIHYLKELFSVENTLQILIHDELRIASFQNSELNQKNLSKDNISELIKLFSASLERDFKIQRPRIAILGAEGHSEDEEEIKSTIKNLQSENILCFGIYPSIEFFNSKEESQFDGIVNLYDDDTLAPFRDREMQESAYFTLGLPVIHTYSTDSVDYELAGKGEASEASLRYAIYLAIDTYRNRKAFDEAHKNPLRKLYVVRGNDNEELNLDDDRD